MRRMDVSCASPTWWSLRGGRTRSHSEHGRETPQRQWYFVSRRGRVGRCQVCKTQHNLLGNNQRPGTNTGRPQGRPICLQDVPYTRQLLCNCSEKAKQRYFAARQKPDGAGWSSPVARQAHNLKAAGSNPAPATKNNQHSTDRSPSAGLLAFPRPPVGAACLTSPKQSDATQRRPSGMVGQPE